MLIGLEGAHAFCVSIFGRVESLRAEGRMEAETEIRPPALMCGSNLELSLTDEPALATDAKIRPEFGSRVPLDLLRGLVPVRCLFVCVLYEGRAHLTQLRDLSHVVVVSLLGVGGLYLDYIL